MSTTPPARTRTTPTKIQRHPAALRAAGIDPAQLENADAATRAALTERSAEHLRSAAHLLVATDPDAKPGELRAARRLLDDQELRERTAAEHSRRRAERRQRRHQRPGP